MDRIMAVEPFVDQALRDATRRRFISERDFPYIAVDLKKTPRIGLGS
jgi:hypothetical protein